MGWIRGLGVVIGATVLGGCAAPAQRDAAGPAEVGVYFASSAPAPRRAGTEFAGPLRWARVDPRFRNDVDELRIDVDNWQRSDGRVANVGPLLVQLADAVDALPRGDRVVGPFRDTAAVRAVAAELNGGQMDDPAQRRAVRASLLLLQKQLMADANGAYAADPRLQDALDELRAAAAAISDSAPDSAVELGFVAARDAMRAFAVSLASGRVIPSD